MYTTDGWGTLYKIDARKPNKGEFVWVTDPGVATRRQRVAVARHRAVGRPRHREPARRTRHRGEPRERRNRVGQESRGHQRVRQPREILHRAHHRRRQGHRRERRGRRKNSRLDCGARRAHRQRTVALVCRAEAWRSGQRDLEGQKQRLEDRRRRHLADRLVRSGDAADHLGHRQSRADLRSAGAPRRQPLHQRGRRPEHRYRQARVVLPVHAERLVGLRRGRRAHAVRHDDRQGESQGRRPLRPERVLLFARSHQRPLHQGQPVRQRPELDQRARSRKPASPSNTIRSSTCRSTIPQRERFAAIR